MDHRSSVSAAEQVLIQERREPTVRYSTSGPVRGKTPDPRALAPVVQRGRQYKTVHEPASTLKFQSENYDLLLAIYTRLSPGDHLSFLEWIVERINNKNAYDRRSSTAGRVGYSDATSSELPLVAEFLIRQHAADRLILALNVVPITPALTHLLLHLRDLVAFNYRAYTDPQLHEMSEKASQIGSRLVTWGQQIRQAQRRLNLIDSNTSFNVAQELPDVVSALVEECREARFLYVKSLLSETENTEVNQDKERLVSRLESMGFSVDLQASLMEAERSYQQATNEFDLKAGMGHLRSFLEGLHREASYSLGLSSHDPAKWDSTLKYLAESLLSREEEMFVSAFYGLTSNAGVHPLKAEKADARLMRNIAIEWGLLLVSKLERHKEAQSEGRSDRGSP